MIETDSSASILHLQAKNKKDNQSKQKIEDFFRNGQPPGRFPRGWCTAGRP